ncbi:MAG: hypothetical protein DWI57_00420 [Chloroflexi bacterium]|nr:MAG: hypothetical protein DWI57_00420 [Chloroflexota bacterium]
MTPFQSLRDYEIFIYTLPLQFTSIQRSTLTVARRGRLYAELSGELTFAGGVRLTVYERLSWDTGTLTIEGYSYEAWRGSDKLYWYDSQPHPHVPILASTDPHHKHVPPDIKHNRIPAPGLTFSAPNLLFLIREVESLLPDEI